LLRCSELGIIDANEEQDFHTGPHRPSIQTLLDGPPGGHEVGPIVVLGCHPAKS
jgi:hypothetical protein